jgi:hypothetical protein
MLRRLNRSDDVDQAVEEAWDAASEVAVAEPVADYEVPEQIFSAALESWRSCNVSSPRRAATECRVLGSDGHHGTPLRRGTWPAVARCVSGGETRGGPPAAWAAEGPRARLGALKTSGSRRTVLLTEVAVATLEVPRSQQIINATTVSDCCDSGLVFTNGLGGPLEPSVPGSTLKRVMRGAAPSRIRVHDLGHTTATVLLAAGVHPKVVQDLLGHRTIVVTMDTYSH